MAERQRWLISVPQLSGVSPGRQEVMLFPISVSLSFMAHDYSSWLCSSEPVWPIFLSFPQPVFLANPHQDSSFLMAYNSHLDPESPSQILCSVPIAHPLSISQFQTPGRKYNWISSSLKSGFTNHGSLAAYDWLSLGHVTTPGPISCCISKLMWYRPRPLNCR